MRLKCSFERAISHYDVLVVVVMPELFTNVVCRMAMLLPRKNKIIIYDVLYLYIYNLHPSLQEHNCILFNVLAILYCRSFI